MPNIKSSKKTVKQVSKKTEANNSFVSMVKNAIKKTEKAIEANDKELAKKELNTVVSNIDKACSKGLITKNTCNRQKSRLNKKVKEMNN